MAVITVSGITKYIKSIVESDNNLNNVVIEGEISNFNVHRATGHLYFSLKDEGAVISAVMFKGAASTLGFAPKDGMKVHVKGRISVYEKSGQYQIYVSRMKQAGLGDLYIEFEKMKHRLFEEGLFNAEHKLALPRYPKTIGIITSKSGAAVKDILNILGRRYPICTAILYPATVQGDGAAESMIKALDYFEGSHTVDIIIIGRGGGAIEDLWCFNDERLARRIYAMTVPIISAVGHETDTTICDFVADLRAPTPSAAAELAVPDLGELKTSLVSYGIRLREELKNKITVRRQRLNRVLSHRMFTQVESVLNSKRLYLDNTVSHLENTGERYIYARKIKLATLSERIDSRSPIKLMTSGYAVATDNQGKRITSISDAKDGDRVNLMLTDGILHCTIDSRSGNNA